MKRLKEYKVRFLPFEAEISVEKETTVLDAVKKANLPLKASCGGEGTCWECLVRIQKGNVPNKATSGLPTHIISQDFVLACQAEVLDNLTVLRPRAHDDLPGGGSRLIQPVSGYVATLVNGEVTRRNDTDTGERPGRLVRST